MKAICIETIPTQKGISIFDINTDYVNSKNGRILQQFCYLPRSDTFSTYFRRISQDNGKTWSTPKVIFEPVTVDKGTWRYSESTLIHDNEEDKTIFLYNYALYAGKTYSENRSASLRIFYKISDDDGNTFSEAIQLIVKGYNSVNWAPDISYGENSAMLSFCKPVKIKGKILLPVAVKYPESTFLSAACFIGEWENGHIEWTMSNVLEISPELSTRGIYEPTISELKDGRLIMVMRGSNGGGYGKVSSVPSYKWYSFSNDGGETWSRDVKPWTYSNGENFFSPSSGSRLIRNSKNGILYWIGNITPENPQGNLPRYPLVIAKVDEVSGCLLKESIRTIVDKKDNQSENIQFSNFRVYEDNITNEFVIVMPHIGAFYKGGEIFDLTSPGYSHRIDLTEV